MKELNEWKPGNKSPEMLQNVKPKNLELNVNQTPSPIIKAKKSNKSPLSLLQHKMRHKQEYDALESLRKRRELIQQRLDAINSRQQARQQHRYFKNRQSNFNVYGPSNRKRSSSNINNIKNHKHRSDSHSDKSNNSHASQNSYNSSNSEASKRKLPKHRHRSRSDYPSKKRLEVKQNGKPPSHPSQPKATSKSPSKPQNYNKITSSNNSSSSNSSNCTPPNRHEEKSRFDHLNHKERIAAKKIAEADARAAIIAESQKKEFEARQMDAERIKHKIYGEPTKSPNARDSPQISISIQNPSNNFLDAKPENEENDICSEPSLVHRESKANCKYNSYSDVENVSEGNENENEEAELVESTTDDEVEEKEIQEEIEILKQTLAEQTSQIQHLRETLHQRKVNELGKSKKNHPTTTTVSSDTESGSDDSGSDVESMLEKQEMTLKNEAKQRLANLKKKMSVRNDSNIKTSNAADNDQLKPTVTKTKDNRTFNQYQSYDEYLKQIENEYPIEQIAEESGEFQHDSESSDDANLHTGKLIDRIRNIKQKCASAMGMKGFQIAYQYMKTLQESDRNDSDSNINKKFEKFEK